MNTNLLAGVPFETFLTCKQKGQLPFKNNNLFQARQELENKILSYDNITFTTEPTTDFVNTESIRLLCNAINPIIPIRRISSIPDRIENKDYASSIGLATIAAILLPEDISNKLENGSKQVFKSAIKVGTTLSSIGITGTLFAPYDPMASITGIGIGSIIASTINKTINSKIKTTV